MSELTCASTPYNQSQQEQQRYVYESSNNITNSGVGNSHTNITSMPLYELQEVIQQYRQHPELLKLILTSKVEEDKRRAEEAKLRAKELDYYLKHDSPPPPASSPTPQSTSSPTVNTLPPPTFSSSVSSSSSLSTSSTSSLSSPSPSASPSSPPSSSLSSSSVLLPSLPSSLSCLKVEIPPTQQHDLQRKMSIPARTHPHQQQPKDRGAPYPSRNNTSISSSRRTSFDHHQQRRHSAAAAMLAMGSTHRPLLPSLSPTSPLLPDQAKYSSDEETDQSATSAYPSPVTDHYEDHEETTSKASTGKPRRRREMQAITKIVETRDFPYMDSYFWRNNGNTTQKKTGCRSIYYKCSNSNKGCQVNKTVTAKQNGEYLIKYRGTHLPECGMVERIRDL